ncbi:centrosomal protein of 72 kDa isoform X4 [Talpa occidentalis]|uniref:centrosomal protein of 72 kDa isoform X4 n=1 Tax=Talpa occidentalis TaxID=50954 RepID=UPI0018905D26|nr:centrosomal protein of 72 kDa isoform X4 [Talpa occidentalis]
MAPAGPRLVLCEERIREKSGLPPHRDLAELRTLSVPGTYQEKITHLGNALMHLTGLTSLDLSRNALVSLEGIQYLAALQSLNLYYNCISSLAEVLRLRALARLSDLDLRLNPVVQCEPDSRLLVLHVLPQLRRLDDRPVRESERTASRLHFASEDSLDSPQSSPAFLRVSRPRLCRARRKDPAAKKGLALDADDEAVLNLIAECEWGLSTPPGSASSGQKEREVDLRGPQGPTDSGDSGASSQRPSLSAQTLLEPPPVPGKCRKRRVLGGRAQAPVEQECLTCLELPEGPASPASPASPGEGLSSSEGQHEQTFPPKEVSEPGEPRTPSWGSARQASPRLPVAPAPKRKAALELARLEALLDLVDRHWSGRRSLHSHEAFLGEQQLKIAFVHHEARSKRCRRVGCAGRAGLRASDQREEALGRDCGAEGAPGAWRHGPGAHAYAAGEPQLPGQHQRAPPAGAEQAAGAAPGRGGAAALELQAAQEDSGPGPPWPPRQRRQPGRPLVRCGGGVQPVRPSPGGLVSCAQPVAVF